MGSIVPLSFVLFLCTFLCTFYISFAAYSVDQEPQYLANFPTLISSSFTAPRPAALSACVNAGQAPNPLPVVNIVNDMDANSFQFYCQTTNLCIIAPGVTITINNNINAAAIINRGNIVWNDNTQSAATQYICAGYLVSEADAVFNLTLSSSQKTAYIYIKDNGARHPDVGIRVFGGSVTGATKPSFPQVHITGHPVRRTWTILADTAHTGNSSIKVVHDVATMGWQVGDRIVIATTTEASKGESQGGMYIKAIRGLHIDLAQDPSLTTPVVFNQDYLGTPQNYMQAEVMLMSRNIIITGDDFRQVPCAANTPFPCRFDGEVYTVGLHTIVNGNNQRFGGLYRIQYTRVEKCGQRGAIGRYCIHFHVMRDCPDCLAHGNSVEYSHQRGIIVHGTHLSKVSFNTLFDVRGANIYIEDGNELHNEIEYNAVVCPYSFDGPKQGCTVPGTDNGEADTSLNHAAYWSLSHTNNFIGNRACNTFNGVFFHPSFAPMGRGFSDGKVCVSFVPLGRVQGNLCHGHGRFGTYFVASDWIRNVHTNLSANGWTDPSECAPWDANGFDRGLSSTIWNNVDYHNVFIGGYAFGDIQFRDHTAISSNCLIYHKETKNFHDGCSAHFKNYHFEDGAALLASGSGTQIFEDSFFVGDFSFESNHHCHEGVTGVLCNPQYIFVNPTWSVTSQKWLTWNEGDNPSRGGSYSLSPPDAANPKSTMFPPGFQSVCHGSHTYLLQLDGGKTCVTSQSLGMGTQYENGILCKKPLRRLEIFTHGLTDGQQGTISLQVSQNGQVVTSQDIPFMIIPADTHKQGFTVPIIATLDYQYRLVRAGGVDPTWIIEFSDPVIGNRWAPDQIYLQVDGRTCPTITTSQHDRRYIWASSDDSLYTWPHGACTNNPDMPPIRCSNVPDIKMMECPELCTNCNGANQYCDCSGKCMCNPGFYGAGCTQDVCASARCGAHGTCTARFLGGDQPVQAAACRCDPGWVGLTCDKNPCQGQTCSGNGVCQSQSENDYYCQCNAGFSGKNCEKTCNNFCTGENGVYPYGCNNGLGHPSFCRTGAGGGCGYDNSLFQNSDWCCFAFCDACLGVTCPGAGDNDCMLPSTCSNGVCGQPQQRADGSVCHSQIFGTCKGGVCVAAPQALTATATDSGSQSTNSDSGTQATNSNSGTQATNSNSGTQATNSNSGTQATNSNSGTPSTNSNSGATSVGQGQSTAKRGTPKRHHHHHVLQEQKKN